MAKGFFREVLTNSYFYLILSAMLFADYYFSKNYSLLDAILDFFIIFIFLLILFVVLKFIERDIKMEGFPIHGWRWIIYIIGWISVLQPFYLVFQAFLQPVFWIFQSFLYIQEEKKTSFFSMNFHKGVYYWGWVIVAGFLSIFLIISFIALLALFG